MIAGRFRLPDLDGIVVEKVLDHMAEQMRPAQGQAWAPLRTAYADALVDLCTNYADVERTGRFKFTIVNHVRADGSADCEGLDVPLETIDAIRPNAKVKTRHEDARGVETHSTPARADLPAAIERHVRERDPHCRVPGCNHTRGLQAHHLVPRCRGGWDGIDNLAMVCPYHHRFLTPHGPWHLIGDPEQIDGLRLVHQDELIERPRQTSSQEREETRPRGPTSSFDSGRGLGPCSLPDRTRCRDGPEPYEGCRVRRGCTATRTPRSSTGQATPRAAEEVARLGLAGLAITDHDVVLRDRAVRGAACAGGDAHGVRHRADAGAREARARLASERP